MRKGVLAVLFLAICPLLTAQQQAMNNTSVIKLVKAGLADDLIVSTINATPGAYDTSANGLIALKQAGATDKVVAAIVLKRAGAAPVPSAPVPSAPPAPASTADAPALPPAVNNVGFYYRDAAGSWQPVSAELVNFAAGGVMKHMASVGLIKEDLNGLIAGNRSHLLLKTPATLIVLLPQGRSPEEYELLRLHVSENTRQFQSVAGGVAHATPGALRDDVEFTSRRIAPNTYQILLNPTIGEGEYGFLEPQEAYSPKNPPTNAKIFTFAIFE